MAIVKLLAVIQCGFNGVGGFLAGGLCYEFTDRWRHILSVRLESSGINRINCDSKEGADSGDAADVDA